MYRRAMENRITKKTQLNDQSSRSHLVFFLEFGRRSKGDGKSSRGTLCLVDLAGSEKPPDRKVLPNDRLQKEADTLRNEGIAINQSLGTLMSEIPRIRKLEDNDDTNATISGSNSTITKLLEHYMRKGSMVLMVLNLNLDFFLETKNTLHTGNQVSPDNDVCQCNDG
ncbi:P-loop containing nucleoside triphosphate hydrolase protein [Xylariaceae sp. FL0255]|nr:P-loop containing nucleoside triphosphate hydrolase protein [Xylariaceae sp. FL0255]